MQFSTAWAVKCGMLSEKTNIQNSAPNKTWISSLWVFIFRGNLRIFQVDTLQRSKQPPETTLCSRWIKWMFEWLRLTISFFSMSEKTLQRSCEDSSRTKKQTQKQCGSLVSTTEGDKDVYKHIAIFRFSYSRWRNKAFFKGSTATLCFISEGRVGVKWIGKNIKYRINIALTVSLDVDVSGLLWFQPERCGDQVEQTIIIRENNFFFLLFVATQSCMSGL